MSLFNEIFKNKKQEIPQPAIDGITPLESILLTEKLELKNLFKQVESQKSFFQYFNSFSAFDFCKTSVESELIARIKHITKDLGCAEYQKDIIKDISYLIKKENSIHLDFSAFIEKLYTLVILQKRFHKKKFYKFYRIIVKKLYAWKTEIFKILTYKIAQKIIINLLSNIIKYLTKNIIQIPRKFDLRAYLDLVLSPKDYCLIALNIYQIALSNNKNSRKNENRLYQTIMPPDRIEV